LEFGAGMSGKHYIDLSGAFSSLLCRSKNALYTYKPILSIGTKLFNTVSNYN